VIASAGGSARHPAWYHNIAAHPDQAWIEFGGRQLRVIPAQLDLRRTRASMAADHPNSSRATELRAESRPRHPPGHLALPRRLNPGGPRDGGPLEAPTSGARFTDLPELPSPVRTSPPRCPPG
jgi:hypothetical protein